MKIRSALAFLPLFFLVLNVQAAILVTETTSSNNSIVSSTNTSSVDVPISKNKGSKKAKKIKNNQKEKVDGFALWGFVAAVTGLISFFVFPPLGLALVPAGLGLSIAGLSRTNRNNSSGKGLAIAGLAIGSAGMLLLLLGFILALAILSNL